MESEPPNADPPKRKRRWFQFSLRSLTLVLLADSGIESQAQGSDEFWKSCSFGGMFIFRHRGGVPMTRFIACVCVGIAVLLSAPRARSQEVKRLGAAADAGTSDTVHNKGTALFDYDNDGFIDVLVASGLAGHSGQGIAVVDCDNDGRPDLFVVGEPRQNHLYRNRGNGTFEEVMGNPMIETIKIEGGKVEINGQSIKIEGAKVEIIRRR